MVPSTSSPLSPADSPPPAPPPTAPDPDSVSVPAAPVAVAVEVLAQGAPPVGVQSSSVVAPSSKTQLPPPPAFIPPGFRPQVVGLPSAVQLEVGDKHGWQEVRGRRRPPQQLPPPSPRGEDVDRAMAFRRRVHGMCFRCLDPGHQVAGCHGRVRCLSCRRSGHRERNCWMHMKASQAPAYSGSPALGPPRPLDRSWASIAAIPAANQDCGPPSRAKPPTVPTSAGPETPPDAMLLPVFVEQARLLRDELQGLASAQLEEMVQPLRVIAESLEGLLGRLGSALERTATALEELSLATAGVRASSAPLSLTVTPPTQGEINACLAGSGALEAFGCFSLGEASQPLFATERAASVVQDMSCPQELVVEPDGLSALEVLKVCGAPGTEKSSKELIEVDAAEPIERASSSLWGEFIDELALMVSRSPQTSQMGEADPSRIERRSGRLDKKNKDCDIPVAKRAEYRRAEAFGEIPKIKSKGKATEEVLNEKMQHYLKMYNKQHTPQVIEAVRDLVEVNA